jgi:hypothetical protein
MSKTLTEIAQQLKDSGKKVQLIYAFNGSGKTRLSREFKELVAPKAEDDEKVEDSRAKVLYYNAFTEDLFYWDNDLEDDTTRKLKIHPNSFTDWVLGVQGKEQRVIDHFQHHTNDKLTPNFNVQYNLQRKDGKEHKVATYPEVAFSIERGDDKTSANLKISKGEESCFIWSLFYSLIEQVIDVLNVVEADNRETDQFDSLEYIFIDDPVSSLDENHLIELAVNLAALIKSSESSELKFIITTHNPLFYNVLHNELKGKICYLLEPQEDGGFELPEKRGDSNQSFSYHLYLKETLEEAIAQGKVERYHFTLLRNLYEKTANFLGYPRWSELLPGDKQAYFNRIIQFTSHSTLSHEAVAQPSGPEKNVVDKLLKHLIENYSYWKEGEPT